MDCTTSPFESESTIQLSNQIYRLVIEEKIDLKIARKLFYDGLKELYPRNLRGDVDINLAREIRVNPLLKNRLLLGAVENLVEANRSLHVQIIGYYHDVSRYSDHRFTRIPYRFYSSGNIGEIIVSSYSTCNSESLTRAPIDQLSLILTNQYALFKEETRLPLIEFMGANPNALLGVYFTDSHHLLDHTLYFSSIADFLFLGHPQNFSFAKSVNPHVYILNNCLTQWNSAAAVAFVAERHGKHRHQQLYGPHNEYNQFPERNEFIKSLNRAGHDHVKLLSGQDWKIISSRKPLEKLAEWANFNTSIIIPTLYDLPIRLFDGLSVGQNVLVPYGCTHLDQLMDAHTQRSLGIIRYEDYDVESVNRAYKLSLENIPSTSERVKRSTFVHNNYSMEQIIEKMIDYALNRVQDALF